MLETLTLTTFLTSGSSSDTFFNWLFSIQHCLLLHKTEGSSNHLFTWSFFLESNPCEASSAGLMLLYWTRFATNTFNWWTPLLIYPKTTLLSVQKILSSIGMSSSFFSIFEILTDNAAAANSSLGIETNFKRETLDFQISRVQCTWPPWLSNLI